MLKEGEHSPEMLISPEFTSSISVSVLVFKCLTENVKILAYVKGKFNELGYYLELDSDGSAIVGGGSSEALIRAKKFLSKILLEKVFPWKTRAISHLKDPESIKQLFLCSETFRNKVMFSNLGDLHLVCTNDIFPSIEETIEAYVGMYVSDDVNIPPGLTIKEQDCQHALTRQEFKDTVVVKVKGKGVEIFAYKEDMDLAKSTLKLFIQDLTEKSEEIRANFFRFEPTVLPLMDDVVRDEQNLRRAEPEENTSTKQVFHAQPSRSSGASNRVIRKDTHETNSKETESGQRVKQTLGSPDKQHQQTHIQEQSKMHAKFTDAMKASPNFQRGSKTMKPQILDNFAGQISIKVYKEDITKVDTEVIVGSNNGYLTRGGVSRIIATAGGDQVMKECAVFIKQHGVMNRTGVMVCSGGDLPVKRIFQAVGPVWDDYSDRQMCLDDVCFTVIRCLCHAEQLGIKTIAFTSISSGICCVPPESCAKMYIRAVLSFETVVKSQHLKEVHFVDLDENILSLIQTETTQRKVPRSIDRDAVFIQRCVGQNTKNQDVRLRSKFLPKDKQCPICLDIIWNKSTLPCGHEYCSECINRSLMDSRTCPVCFVPVDAVGNLVPESIRGHMSNLSGLAGASCAICLHVVGDTKRIRCGHQFCTQCIDGWLEVRPVCPVCYTLLGPLVGDMPPGYMDIGFDDDCQLPGFEGVGSIFIHYSFDPGCQTEVHPHPGKSYQEVEYSAYLPNNAEGRRILELLQEAWKRRLTFTIQDAEITWNNIHHKTAVSGGPDMGGYPDPGFLQRVKEELAMLGVTQEDLVHE